MTAPTSRNPACCTASGFWESVCCMWLMMPSTHALMCRSRPWMSHRTNAVLTLPDVLPHYNAMHRIQAYWINWPWMFLGENTWVRQSGRVGWPCMENWTPGPWAPAPFLGVGMRQRCIFYDYLFQALTFPALYENGEGVGKQSCAVFRQVLEVGSKTSWDESANWRVDRHACDMR